MGYAIIAATALFCGSFVFFVGHFIHINGSLIYPVYLAAPVVYLTAAVFALLSGKVTGRGFKKSAGKYLVVPGIFVLLFAAPLFGKINIPDPHNFALRKLELILGMSYALFVSISTFLAAKDVIANPGKSRRGTFIAVIALFFIFYASISMWFNYANQPTGDEPIYLIVAHSLVHDRDLDLTNNYTGRDYSAFFNGNLIPQESPVNGKYISYHPVLLSAVLAPFYFLAGRLGATLFINFLCAVLCGMIFLTVLGSGKSVKNSLLMSFIAGFSLPVLASSNMIATETVSALLLTAAFYVLMFKKERNVITVALLAAVFAWTHPRNFFVWSFFCLIVLFEYRTEIIEAAKFAVIQAAAVLAWVLFNYAVYGTVYPSQAYGFSLNISGFIGILMDQEFGLFFYTPVFVLIFSGLVLLFKRKKKIFFYNLMIILPLYLIMSCWIDWRGGGGASPRFFVPIITFFILPLSELYAVCENTKKERWFVLLTAAGFAVSLFIMLVPWFRWNKGLGQNWILKFMSGFIHHDLSVLFPSLWAPKPNEAFTVAIWTAIAVIANVYFIVPKIPKRKA